MKPRIGQIIAFIIVALVAIWLLLPAWRHAEFERGRKTEAAKELKH